MHHHPPPTGWLSTLDKRPGSSRGPMWERSGAATMEDMATTDVVTVRGLRKTYGNLVVVDRLDLDVPAGEIVGLAGTDGAGKTTTVECIKGLRRPDAGPAGHPRRRTASCRPAVGAAPISQHAAQRGDLDRALCLGRPTDRHRPRCRDLRKRPWGRPRPTAGRRSPAQRTAEAWRAPREPQEAAHALIRTWIHHTYRPGSRTTTPPAGTRSSSAAPNVLLSG